MCNLYERISKLCEQRGITSYKLCKDTGISNGIMTDLKAGRKQTLQAGTADKIARYFGVSVGYLLGTEDEADKDILQDLCDTDRALLHSIVELTDDQKKMMQIFIRGLKGEENG